MTGARGENSERIRRIAYDRGPRLTLLVVTPGFRSGPLTSGCRPSRSSPDVLRTSPAPWGPVTQHYAVTQDVSGPQPLSPI